MWIPSIFVGFVLGILFVIVPVSFYEILLNYAALEEQKEEDKKIKTKGWIKRGWRNAKRDWKKKFKKKKKEGENTYRKKIEKERLHKTIEGLVE